MNFRNVHVQESAVVVFKIQCGTCSVLQKQQHELPNLSSSSQINSNGNSPHLNIWNIPTIDTVEFEENNRNLLRIVNFAFMILNPILDYSYVVLNFWANLSLSVLIKLFFLKKKRVGSWYYFKIKMYVF